MVLKNGSVKFLGLINDNILIFEKHFSRPSENQVLHVK